MGYSQIITTKHRTALAMLLDLSGSMGEVIDFEGSKMLKGESLAKICNKILRELYMRSNCCGELCDYFDVAILGYSGSGVQSLIGECVESPFVSITKLFEGCEEEGIAELVAMTPFDNHERLAEVSSSVIRVATEGASPMYEGMLYMQGALERWCKKTENYDSFPPSLIHITDGHSTDCDLDSIIDISNRVTHLATNDGEVLLYNIQLEDSAYSESIIFPTNREIAQIYNPYTKTLALAASPLPKNFEDLANELRATRSIDGYRCMGCNVAMIDVLAMMSIGTLSTHVR